jgi:hypothetical protein
VIMDNDAHAGRFLMVLYYHHLHRTCLTSTKAASNHPRRLVTRAALQRQPVLRASPNTPENRASTEL